MNRYFTGDKNDKHITGYEFLKMTLNNSAPNSVCISSFDTKLGLHLFWTKKYSGSDVFIPSLASSFLECSFWDPKHHAEGHPKQSHGEAKNPSWAPSQSRFQMTLNCPGIPDIQGPVDCSLLSLQMITIIPAPQLTHEAKELNHSIHRIVK